LLRLGEDSGVVLGGGQKVDLEAVAVLCVNFTHMIWRSVTGVDLPVGDILETGSSVAALGGIDVGGDLLLNRGVDIVVDKDNVDSSLVGAIMQLAL
jgi:hypothetical protein